MTRHVCCLAAGIILVSALTSGEQGSGTPAGTASDELRKAFATVSGHVTKAADLVPPDKYAYRPTASVRTFGELVAHFVDGYAYFCGTAAGRRVEWSDATEKGKTDKGTLAQSLKRATDACNAAYASGGRTAPLIENLAHTNLHYGNVITYMRMIGLVPPSS